VHADICNIKSRHTFDPYFRVIVTETAPVIADSRDWEAAENSRLTWDGPPASLSVGPGRVYGRRRGERSLTPTREPELRATARPRRYTRQIIGLDQSVVEARRGQRPSASCDDARRLFSE